MTLRIGLAGCGRIASYFHLGILRRLPGVRLAALAEADPERLRRASRRAPEAAAFASLDDLLDAGGLDALVICLPSGQHARAAAAAFRAGLHVYLEKPLATGPEEAAEVLEAWRRSGRLGMVGFNLRRHPLYEEARAWIARGRLGPLVACRTVLCSGGRQPAPWKRLRPSGGGALLDLGSHHVDLARFLFGREVLRVAAALSSLGSDEDTAVLDLELEGGLRQQSLFSLAAVEEERVEIYGERGKLSVERHGEGLVFTPPMPPAGRAARLAWGLRILARTGRRLAAVAWPRPDPSFARSLEAFARAVRNGDPGAGPDLDEGWRSLQVVLAAEEAARSGRPVDLAVPRVR